MKRKDFVDQISLFCKSGNGGPGSVHFLRSKGDWGGTPDGGDGGEGGSIYLKGNSNKRTLIEMRYRKHIIAENGEKGSKNNCSGKKGSSITLELPLGTQVYDPETNELMAEVTKHNEIVTLLKGGIGGHGNFYFKSSTNRSPKYAQKGIPGIEKWLIFELKIMADIGLVGFPNAGKSSLVSSLSEAKPKIANYPFTTLVPTLGLVKYHDSSFTISDLPGIIEGAHLGKGLGLQFLRHIERNGVLGFTVSSESENISNDFNILLNEVKNYKEELIFKEKILIITKSDLILDIEKHKKKIEKKIEKNIEIIYTSSASGFGLEDFKKLIIKKLKG